MVKRRGHSWLDLSRPRHSRRLLPFLRAGSRALIFTLHLILLIEHNSNDSTVLGEQQSQLII